MSATETSPPPPPPTAAAPPRPSARARLGFTAWARVLAACAILLGSAGVRAWQTWRIEKEMAIGRERPRFDPTKVGLAIRN